MKLNRLLSGIFAIILFTGLVMPFIPAEAATGDVLTSFIPAPAGNGRAVAYDGGTTLYYTNTASTDIYTATTAGVSNGPIPNPGPRTFTCGGLSWDSSTSQLWCGSYDGSTNVYTINPVTGVPTLQFDETAFGGIAQDSCFFAGAENFIDGMAHDSSDNTIWLSGDGSQTIYHLTAAGALLGSFTAPTNPNGGQTACVSGMEVAGNFLDVADVRGAGNLGILKINKADNVNNPTVVTSFLPIGGTEDLSLDPITFAPVCALWADNFGTNLLVAYEVPSYQCGGAVVGGEFSPIDNTALVLAGLQTSAIWMLPILAGAVGVGSFYIKSRMNED